MSETVSVLIPCRNEKKNLQACLDSILAQDYPSDLVEILVIDGMSEDGTRGILEIYASKHKNIEVLDNPRKITPCALNIGIKNARGDIIVRADAHSEYAQDYIQKCCEFLNRAGADNVGGVVEHKGDGFIGQAIAYAQSCRFGLGGAKFRTAKKAQYVDTIFPGSWRKSIFDIYGLFDERLARNQDIEHNARIRKNGGKVFLTPEIKSYYYCRSSLNDLWIQYFRNGFWNIKTINIAPDSLSLRHFIPLFFVISLLTTWIIPWLWLGVVISYLSCNFFFSLKIAAGNGFKYFFIMPAVFLTLHLSYGLGLLAGIIEFLTSGLRRREQC
jgi:glycosyltransferase involved in cell wall biosynthesis